MQNHAELINQYRKKMELMESTSPETVVDRIFLSLERLTIGTCYIFDGEDLHIYNMPEDRVELRKQVREYLAIKKECLLDLSPVGIYLLTHDGKILIYTSGY